MKNYALLFFTFALAISANESVFKLDKTNIPPSLLSDLVANITTEGGGFFPKRIVEVEVPNCQHIKFNPFKYDQAAQGIWFNLELPGVLYPKFRAYNGAPPDQGPNVYGREHIYEVQMVAIFIASLQNTPALWNPTSTPVNFCDWVKKYVIEKFDSSQPLINNLKGCLPNNKQPGWMPWLEKWAGAMKANSIAGVPIRTEHTFREYSNDIKVADIRTLVGVASYMDDEDVKKAFDSQSQCIRKEWLAWLPRYATATSTKVDENALSTLYDDWIVDLQKNARQNLKNAFNDMIGWWQAENGNNLVNVNVGFNSWLETGNARDYAPASASILGALVQYM